MQEHALPVLEVQLASKKRLQSEGDNDSNSAEEVHSKRPRVANNLVGQHNNEARSVRTGTSPQARRNDALYLSNRQDSSGTPTAGCFDKWRETTRSVMQTFFGSNKTHAVSPQNLRSRNSRSELHGASSNHRTSRSMTIPSPTQQHRCATQHPPEDARASTGATGSPENTAQPGSDVSLYSSMSANTSVVARASLAPHVNRRLVMQSFFGSPKVPRVADLVGGVPSTDSNRPGPTSTRILHDVHVGGANMQNIAKSICERALGTARLAEWFSQSSAARRLRTQSLHQLEVAAESDRTDSDATSQWSARPEDDDDLDRSADATSGSIGRILSTMADCDVPIPELRSRDGRGQQTVLAHNASEEQIASLVKLVGHTPIRLHVEDCEPPSLSVSANADVDLYRLCFCAVGAWDFLDMQLKQSAFRTAGKEWFRFSVGTHHVYESNRTFLYRVGVLGCHATFDLMFSFPRGQTMPSSPEETMDAGEVHCILLDALKKVDPQAPSVATIASLNSPSLTRTVPQSKLATFAADALFKLRRRPWTMGRNVTVNVLVQRIGQKRTTPLTRTADTELDRFVSCRGLLDGVIDLGVTFIPDHAQDYTLMFRTSFLDACFPNSQLAKVQPQLLFNNCAQSSVAYNGKDCLVVKEKSYSMTTYAWRFLSRIPLASSDPFAAYLASIQSFLDGVPKSWTTTICRSKDFYYNDAALLRSAGDGLSTGGHGARVEITIRASHYVECRESVVQFVHSWNEGRFRKWPAFFVCLPSQTFGRYFSALVAHIAENIELSLHQLGQCARALGNQCLEDPTKLNFDTMNVAIGDRIAPLDFWADLCRFACTGHTLYVRNRLLFASFQLQSADNVVVPELNECLQRLATTDFRQKLTWRAIQLIAKKVGRRTGKDHASMVDAHARWVLIGIVLDQLSRSTQAHEVKHVVTGELFGVIYRYLVQECAGTMAWTVSGCLSGSMASLGRATLQDALRTAVPDHKPAVSTVTKLQVHVRFLYCAATSNNWDWNAARTDATSTRIFGNVAVLPVLVTDGILALVGFYTIDASPSVQPSSARCDAKDARMAERYERAIMVYLIRKLVPQLTTKRSAAVVKLQVLVRGLFGVYQEQFGYRTVAPSGTYMTPAVEKVTKPRILELGIFGDDMATKTKNQPWRLPRFSSLLQNARDLLGEAVVESMCPAVSLPTMKLPPIGHFDAWNSLIADEMKAITNGRIVATQQETFDDMVTRLYNSPRFVTARAEAAAAKASAASSK